MISRVIRAKWYLKGNILGIPCKPITMGSIGSAPTRLAAALVPNARLLWVLSHLKNEVVA
jgi:hypothetical protein